MAELISSQNFEIFRSLILAIILGAAIGVEREIAHKSAGMRTHALVAFGSALFSAISMTVAGSVGNPTFIASQIVTGVGFLGAGIIIFHGEKIQGLTTAAGIWVAAGVGMAAGFQMYIVSIFAAVLTILVFAILWPIEKRIFSKSDETPQSVD